MRMMCTAWAIVAFAAFLLHAKVPISCVHFSVRAYLFMRVCMYVYVYAYAY